MKNNQTNFGFFGSDAYAAIVLDELEALGFLPSLVVAAEDKPAGRKLTLTPPPAKVWAEKRNIEVLQPARLDDDFISKLKTNTYQLFVVAFYNKILSRTVLDIPLHGALNIHPSLLPRLRGPSPVKTAILEEDETGVTIILLDELMDHGPIIGQEKSEVTDWPPYESNLREELTRQGAKLLAHVIPAWIKGEITARPQDEALATTCGKIKKSDGLIDLSGDPEKNLRKIRAFEQWPRAYFLFKHKGRDIRVLVTRAHMENGALVIEQVIPEGKSEMSYEDFLRGYSDK